MRAIYILGRAELYPDTHHGKIPDPLVDQKSDTPPVGNTPSLFQPQTMTLASRSRRMRCLNLLPLL